MFSGIVGNEDFLAVVHHPSAGVLGIIVSIYNLGCFTGTIVSFITGDRLGPRKSMWFAMVWIIVSLSFLREGWVGIHRKTNENSQVFSV